MSEMLPLFPLGTVLYPGLLLPLHIFEDRYRQLVADLLANGEAPRFGVVAIVTAQEFQWVFSAKKRATRPGVAMFEFVKEERRVGMYYFYIADAQFGPGFIKVCTYFPYPAKVCLLTELR